MKQNLALTLMIALGFVALNLLMAAADFIAVNFSNILGPISLIAIAAGIIVAINKAIK